jgi:hypoxanthine phosphoribosyltransferase
MKKLTVAFNFMALSIFSINPDTIKSAGQTFTPYISAQEIAARISELGAQISSDYAGKEPLLIGIMKGSFIFMADLIREISIDCEIDFLKISSYGHAQKSSGSIKLLEKLNCEIADRDIIIVEDILDTGLSLKYICELLQEFKPRSISIAVLLKKDIPGQPTLPTDYIGFIIPPEFVIGYGLDLAEKYRNLPNIYRAEKS